MASKPDSHMFFFVFDFYQMKDSSDSNDVIPAAVIYFYPLDVHLREQKLLECGEIVGIVQYFQHDLFHSVPKSLYFQNSIVAHEYYGRHSAFLSLPQDQYTIEEAEIYLKNILNLSNTLYGTWNRVHSIYGQNSKMNEFLNEAMTPIIASIFNRPRSVPNMFLGIECAPLKQGSQRILLESRHYLACLRANYGLLDGFLGYDNKILHSTWDSETTFYIQLILQLRKVLPKNFFYVQWESEFKLQNGVSLYRVFLRKPNHLTSNPSINDQRTTSTSINIRSSTISKSKTSVRSMTMLNDSLSALGSATGSEESYSDFSYLSSSMMNGQNSQTLLQKDQSGSSEDMGFETDTTDEVASPNNADTRSLSSEFADDLSKSFSNDSNSVSTTPPTPQCDEESLTDDAKLLRAHPRSRSSTMSNELEKTLKLDLTNYMNETIDKIDIVEVDQRETMANRMNSMSDAEDSENDISSDTVPLIPYSLSDSSRDRTSTMTVNTDENAPEFLKSERHEVRVNWTNISDKNSEVERDELILYVQKNSRLILAGVIQPESLNDEYLKTLWRLTLHNMAAMETEIKTFSTPNDINKLSSETKFQFIESVHAAQFEIAVDGTRYICKIPSEESSHTALFARSKLKQSSECKVVGLSRGNHLISADRYLPDRMSFSCRRFQETY